ncbi:MAG: hypothetical protein IH962_00295 [Chloroflexi bacterium]|nr:hypothetical protein [Chloroflexota bacterium]
MVLLTAIPIVHFVGAPIGPFVGGYFGITSADGDSRSPASKSMIFGALLGLLVFLISATAAAILTVITGWNVWFLWGVVAVFTLYTWSMSGLGAMYSQLRRATPPAT